MADRESGLSARTIARRLSSVSGFYAYLVARGDTGVALELATALEPYEGWGFRLVIEDRVRDVRSDAEIIEPHGPEPGTGSDDG